MYKIIIILYLALIPWISWSQDIYQSNLYSAELIFEYKDEIKLTGEQEQKIKEIYKNTNAEFTELKLELRSMNHKMETMLESTSVDKLASEAQLAELLALENKIKQLRFSSLVEIKNVLTPDQQNYLNRYNKNFKKYNESGILLGDGYEVKIRVGGEDITSSEDQPLFILEYKGEKHTVVKSGISDLDPSEIEAIEVIKGEKATREYGDKGEDGVIIISVKSKKSYQRIVEKDL